MSFKIEWDKSEEKIYETGVDRGVLYPKSNNAYPKGVAWNGLTNVNENPTGAEPTALYADNIKYLELMSSEQFGATVEAYTYPDEFGECNGEKALSEGVSVAQQSRKPFGMSYRTKIGNEDDPDLGYKINLIYNAKAKPSQKSYNTVNETPEAITFSWEISTTPIDVPDMKPTAHIIIDSTKVDPDKLAALESILYGTAGGDDPRLPLPSELVGIFNGKAVASIAVTTAPTKVAYQAGDNFDATGMVITATYTDETTAVVTDYAVTPSTNLATTDTAVTISYTSGGVTKKATQAITVTAG